MFRAKQFSIMRDGSGAITTFFVVLFSL